LAAALTAIAIAVIGWPDQSSEDFADYARRIWGEPMLWLGASIMRKFAHATVVSAQYITQPAR
jgi:hypothetical protein